MSDGGAYLTPTILHTYIHTAGLDFDQLIIYLTLEHGSSNHTRSVVLSRGSGLPWML